ncbi:MAG: tRNA pseudouridine(38-40) synthase TruA [Deltaproteobacteria bacterium]|nr:tRNA pseudouridine(38-40) synthase TruA [Deltaproteobacteria bacterium]
MPTYKLTIEYNGTEFRGWQAHENIVSIQGKLLEALKTALRTDVALQGASRTDAGVHALGQVASIRLAQSINEHRLARSLCALCKPHIAVTKVEQVNDDFNARFDARGKHYLYRVLNRSAPSPLLQSVCWHVAAPLDLDKMRRCATVLMGTHDFAAFRASDCERDSTERTITAIDIERQGPVVEIHVRGTAFLKNMVRIIAGTLVDIGRGALPEDTVDVMLATKDRTRGGRTAPACGLTLVTVFFDENALRQNGIG